MLPVNQDSSVLNLSLSARQSMRVPFLGRKTTRAGAIKDGLLLMLEVAVCFACWTGLTARWQKMTASWHELGSTERDPLPKEKQYRLTWVTVFWYSAGSSFFFSLVAGGRLIRIIP
ncbi:hypothetical protein BD289DRAFT_167205 [Coniella lustricola]|uniref:Uncharacterized protein n=1 Tax=Coniella lustricola TaxID=2025994 RepID=A0A2T3AE87_9PEZI|nr:hypothetical protein BD289DRAFT_167205 [Coniella lustricola]